MGLIRRWQLETFRTTDINDARQVVWTLDKRGFTHVSFSDTVGKNEYKTYAKIDLVNRDLEKCYYVEYMALSTGEKS
jgi:hypothetical protein